MQQGNGTHLEQKAALLDSALPCISFGPTAACAYCHAVPDGPRACPARMSQKAIVEEIAAQRAIRDAQTQLARDGSARASDEMRGGLHAYGGTAQTTHNGATGERYFTRTEVLTFIRTYGALHGEDMARRVSSTCAEMARIFERLE